MSMKVVTPWGHSALSAGLIGRFNASNLLACLGVLLASNVSLGDALDALAHTHPVAGRMQRLGGDGQPTVIVDYAHTPDAMDKTLATLRDLTPGRLVCVFGCGGNRDKGKRPLMGEVAARLADRVVVTSDNPRNEAPETIIADILTGMPPGQHVEIDRASAIRLAIVEAGSGDVVLIAGKGHEDYQEIGGVRHPFSDVAQAELALKERCNASA
jgi:UDP-N-acetylmuramoyl-L-alanyl-D-glutamate--2,6-diaminopimelate ligase